MLFDILAKSVIKEEVSTQTTAIDQLTKRIEELTELVNKGIVQPTLYVEPTATAEAIEKPTATAEAIEEE